VTGKSVIIEIGYKNFWIVWVRILQAIRYSVMGDRGVSPKVGSALLYSRKGEPLKFFSSGGL
jgi:hypothetical protein